MRFKGAHFVKEIILTCVRWWCLARCTPAHESVALMLHPNQAWSCK